MKNFQKLTEKYLPPDNDLDLSIDSLPSVISERPNQAFISPLPYQSDPKVFQKWRAYDNAANFKESREVVKKQANQHFKPAFIGGHAHHPNPKMEYVVEMNDQNQAPSSKNKAPYSSLSKKVVKGIKSSTTANDENQPGMVSYGIVGAERPVIGQEYENLMRNHSNKATLKPPQMASPKMNINAYYDQSKDPRNQYVITQQQNRAVNQPGRANMREREGVLQEKNFNAPMQQVYDLNMYTRQLDERKGTSFDQGNESQSFHQSQMSERQDYQPIVFNEHESHPSMFSTIISAAPTSSFQKKDDGMFSYSGPQNMQTVTNSSIIEFTPNEMMTDYQLMTELTERTKTEKDQRRYIDLENTPNPLEKGMRPSYGYIPEQERSLIDIVVNNRYQSSGKKMKDVEPTISVNNLPLKEYANFYKPKDLNVTDNSSMMEGTRYYSPESKRHDTQEEFYDMDQPPSQRNTQGGGAQQSANASFVSCMSEPEVEGGEAQGRGSVGNRESEPNYGSVIDPNTYRSQYEQQQQHYGLSRITEEDESLTHLTHNISKERETSPKRTDNSIEINPLLMSVETVSTQPYLMNFVNDPTSQAAIAFKNSLDSQKIFNNHLELEKQQQQEEQPTKSAKSDHSEDNIEKETLPERQSESQAPAMEKDLSEIIPAESPSLVDLTSQERSFKSPAKHEKSPVKENSPTSEYYLDTSVATRNFEPALSNKNHNIAQSSNTGNQSVVTDLQSLRNTENQLQSVGSEDTARRSLMHQEVNAYSIENLESIDITATLEIADTILKNSKKPEPEVEVVASTKTKPPVKLLHSIPSKLMPDPWPGYPEENYLTIRLINAPPAPSEIYSAREEKEKQVFESAKKEKEEPGQSIIQYHWNQARQSLETLEREVNNTNTSATIEPVALPKQEIYTSNFVEASKAENLMQEKSGNELHIKEVSSQMVQITEGEAEKEEIAIKKEKEEEETESENDSQTRLEPIATLEKSENNSEEQKSSQMIFETRHSTSLLNTEPAAQRFSQDINLQAFSDISNVENRSSIKTESVPSGPVQVHLSIDELEKLANNNEKKLEGQQQNIENYYWAERHNSLSKQLAQGYPQGVKEQKRLNSPLEGILTQSLEISPSMQIESHLLTHSDTEAYLLNKLNDFSTTPFQVNAPEDIDKRHSLSGEKLDQIDSQGSGERPSHSELDADKLMNSANYQDFSHEIHDSPLKGGENMQAQIDNMFSYDGEMDLEGPIVVESAMIASIDPRTSHMLLGRGPLPVIEEINSTHIQETSANEVENSLEFKRHFSNIDIDQDYCMTEPGPVLSRVLTDSPNPLSNRSLNTFEMGQSPGFEIVQANSSQKAFSGIDAVSYSNQITDDNLEEEIQKLQAELMLLSSKHREKAAVLNIPPSKLKQMSEEEKALLHQHLYEDFKRREDLKKSRELAKKAEEERSLAEMKTVGAAKTNLTRNEQADLISRLYVVKDKSRGSDTRRSEIEVFNPEALIAQARSPLKATAKVVSGPAAYGIDKKKENKAVVREKKNQGKENQALTKKVNSSQELHRQRQILVINNNKSPEASIKTRLQLPVESSGKSRTSVSDSESFEMLMSPEAMKAQTMSYDGFLSNYNSMVKNKLDTPKTKSNSNKMRNSTSFK